MKAIFNHTRLIDSIETFFKEHALNKTNHFLDSFGAHKCNYTLNKRLIRYHISSTGWIPGRLHID